jgi:site-specific recombinase XerD
MTEQLAVIERPETAVTAPLAISTLIASSPAQTQLSAHYSPDSFRATGITNFLENDGSLEVAQRIAGHADSRTTKLNDRRGQKVLLEDMERNAELGISLQMPSMTKC